MSKKTTAADLAKIALAARKDALREAASMVRGYANMYQGSKGLGHYGKEGWRMACNWCAESLEERANE